MRRTLQTIGLIAALVLLAAPATADAAHYAPPGKAGATQYFETIPSSGGNVAPPSYNPHPSSPTANSQSAASPTLATVGTGSHGSKKLSKMGTTGQAAANFAQATSPAVPAAGTSAALRELAANPGGSATGSLWNLLTGSDAGGIGVFMPLLLGLSLLVALGVAATRLIRR